MTNSEDEHNHEHNVVSPNVAGAGPLDRKAVADKALSMVKVAWSFSKATAIDLNERRKAAMAKYAADLAEAKRVAQIKRFNDAYSALKSLSTVINPDAWQAIQNYEANAGGNAELLARFADHETIKSLIKYGKARQAFVQEDAARQSRTHTFTTNGESLFEVLGPSIARPMLGAIINKYKVSSGGNVLAAGILAGRKNYGGAAMAAAENMRISAHNGMVGATFDGHMRALEFHKSATEMQGPQQRYVVYAYRLLFMGVGDQNTVLKALFSLIYDNGHANPRPPEPFNKFSGQLFPEFHNNFSSYIWTVRDAAAQLDVIRSQSAFSEALFSETDIAPYMKRFTDTLPDFSAAV